MPKSIPMAALLVLGALAGACRQAPRTTENFTGTLASHTAASNTVVLTVDGDIEATLASISPSVAVGLGIGAPTSGGACTLLASEAAATAGTTIWTDAQPGTYCVLVYDVGNLSESAHFTVTVTHP